MPEKLLQMLSHVAQAWMLVLFPLHFFFHFLYYTDVGSLTFVVAAYLVSLTCLPLFFALLCKGLLCFEPLKLQASTPVCTKCLFWSPSLKKLLSFVAGHMLQLSDCKANHHCQCVTSGIYTVAVGQTIALVWWHNMIQN